MAQRVGLIIPAYNAGRYIGQALESALGQTHQDLEILVVDDGSTDHTAELLDNYRHRIQYVYQKNQGRSAARNSGLYRSTGEFITFLDADDLLVPEKIAQLVSCLERHPDYGVAYSAMEYFWEDGRRLAVPTPAPSGDILPDLLWRSFITTSVPLFRRQALLSMGGFDPRADPIEDWDLCLRLAMAGYRFIYVNQLHTLCRVHPGNTSTNLILMADKTLEVLLNFTETQSQPLRQRGLPVAIMRAFHRARCGKYLIAAGQIIRGRGLIAAQKRIAYPGRWKYNLLGMLAAVLPGAWLVKLLETLERATHKRIY